MSRSPLALPYGKCAELAARVGCTAEWISKILHDKKRPSADMAILIDATGIVRWSVMDKYYPRPKKRYKKTA